MLLSFTESKKCDWETRSFWEEICPSLKIEKVESSKDHANDQYTNPTTFTTTTTTIKTCQKSQHEADSSGGAVVDVNYKKAREHLRNKGYALIDQLIFPQSKLDQVRNGIERLHALGFPASFILLFDVTWDIAAISRELFRETCLETNQFQFDILAWHITGEGFSPHRDRQPPADVAVSSTFVNQDAKFVTQWIALTPATPQNSCLYMIPKQYDPGYLTGDVDDEDPLRRALPEKQAFQRIVALPRDPGQSLLFTHRIIHWGSARDPNADKSLGHRIAISFVCSDPSFEKPYLKEDYFTHDKRPPFRIRLLLVCAQLLIYYQRFDLPKEVLRMCYTVCKEMEGELEESYRNKVSLEFVKAMKEHDNEDHNKDSSPSDDEEAVLEAMLEAEEGGLGDDFVDDYDEDESQNEELGDDDDCFEEGGDEEEEDTEIQSPESKRQKV